MSIMRGLKANDCVILVYWGVNLSHSALTFPLLLFLDSVYNKTL